MGGQSGATRPSFCVGTDQASKLVKSLPSLRFHLLFWKNRMKDGSGVLALAAPPPAAASACGRRWPPELRAARDTGLRVRRVRS